MNQTHQNDTGVTNELNGSVRCEWCDSEITDMEEIAAVRPRNHAVMMCSNCMPDPPEEWRE